MISLPSQLEGLRKEHKHRFCTLWKIERTDGVTLRFADRDESVTFEGEVYKFAGSLEASAKQLQEGLNTRNFEARGIINSDDITQDDLRAGRYREAKITEYLVDARTPWAGAFFQTTYWIADITFDGRIWNASVQDISRWLRMKVGDVYQRNCRWDLGDAKCGHALGGSFEDTKAVSAVDTQRLVFRSSTLLSTNPGFFAYGKVIWSTGDNAGLISEVKSYSGSSSKIVTLQLRTPFDIQVGDVFHIVAGCDKTFATCKSKFSNGTRFGGFPHIPGTEKLLITPNAR